MLSRYPYSDIESVDDLNAYLDKDGCLELAVALGRVAGRGGAAECGAGGRWVG